MSSQDDPMGPAHTVPQTAIEPVAVDSELVANACLVVAAGKNSGRVFALLGRETLIGRATGAHVRLEEKSISTHHAKVIRNGERHALLDLGSTNGTYLNGERVQSNQPMELTLGDSIQISDTVLSYVPSRTSFSDGQTQYLANISLQPKTTDLRLPAETQGLVQLLRLANLQEPAEPKPPTLDERIDTLLRFFALLRRHMVLLLSMAAICALIGNLSVFMSPPRSEASFTLRVSPPPPSNPNERSDATVLDFYSAVEQNFVNPGLVEQTLRAMGAKNVSPPAVRATLSELKFESMARQMYTGAYKHQDPAYAVGFLRKHLENYLAAEIQKSIHVVQAQAEFLADRLKERDGELRRTEEEMRQFKSKHMDGLPDYAQQHITSREDLYSRRAALSGQLSRTNLELNLARKRLTEEQPLLTRKVESASPYQQALIDVKRRLGEAKGKGLGDDHPEIIALKAQAAEYQRLADQARSTNATELERGANPGLIELRNRVGDLEVASKGAGAELGEINAQLSRLDGIVNEMPEVEARYAQLTRSYASSKELHSRLFEQLKSSQLQLDLERTSAKARYEVIVPPASSGIPLRKTLLLRTGIGIAVGLMLAALVIIFSEIRRVLQAHRKRSTALVTRDGPLALR